MQRARWVKVEGEFAGTQQLVFEANLLASTIAMLYMYGAHSITLRVSSLPVTSHLWHTNATLSLQHMYQWEVQVVGYLGPVQNGRLPEAPIEALGVAGGRP